jgi:hypothetical protein
MAIDVKIGMAKKVNTYIVMVWQDYHMYAGLKERQFDIYLPLVLSVIFVGFTALIVPMATDVIGILKDLNNAALNVISILAGFNTASLSVIAASNFAILGRLFGSEREDSKSAEKSNLLKQTISFFGYAILIQLGLLVLGAILVFVFGSVAVIAKDHPWPLWNLTIKWVAAVFSFFWIGTIFHSLFVSIRNITVLYNYVLLIGHEANQQNKEAGDNTKY